jgi:hypothetical protein
MRRHTFIRLMHQAIKPDDVAIFIGDDVCREAHIHDRPGNLYLSDNDDYMLSLVLGVALNTKLNVFVFCEDSYLIRNLSELAQMAVSKLVNLRVVVYNSKVYLDKPFLHNIMGSVANPHGLFFNMGFKVHDYSKSFNRQRNPLKELEGYWNTVVGPVIVLMNIQESNKKFDAVPEERVKDFRGLNEFIVMNSVVDEEEQIERNVLDLSNKED